MESAQYTEAHAMITTLKHIPRKLLVDLGRAFGGAIIFALPMLMTMEMWQLGFHMDRVRLAVLLALFLLVLMGLNRYSGFEESHGWREHFRDALVGYAVGFSASALILGVFGQLTLEMPLREWIGKISIQAVPAGMGAILARTQLGSREPEASRRELAPRGPLAFYFGELFIMAAGALFLAFNVAPTEEIVLLALTMGPLHLLALLAVSLGAMHGFVYAVGYAGQAEVREGHSHRTEFFIFTVPGYLVALGVSAIVLVLLDRLDGLTLYQDLRLVLVLGFPAAIGAAAARLIL
jgi:putative integral membrane protein (TIGR02587 family)